MGQALFALNRFHYHTVAIQRFIGSLKYIKSDIHNHSKEYFSLPQDKTVV